MYSVGFNGLLVRRFLALCSLLFRGKKAVLLLAGLMFVVVTYEFISYQVGLISSRYYRVLQDKDLHGFWIQTALGLSLVFAISKTRALRTFLASTAGVHWRKLITVDLHGLYFAGKNHYDVNVVDGGELDNADQRMTQDVDRFCRTLAETLPPALIAPFTAGYYNYQAYVATGWIGPVSTLVFFLVFTILNKFLMSPVVPRVYQQQKQEGQFRHAHTRFRDNSESIAFLDGEPVEKENADTILGDVVKAQQSVVNREFPLNFGIHLFDYTGAILSLLVIAVPIFNGVYDSLTPGELSQLISKNAFVSIYLISCYSSLVDLSGNVAVIAGNTHRIMALREKLQALCEELRDTKCGDASTQKGTDDSDEHPTGDGSVDDRPSVELQDVTYSSPRDGGLLVEKLTWMLDDKRKALITGASGSGKTTLLRVIKGLRSVDSGCVRVMNAHSLAFFPQSPWLTSGSLRKQIRYPSDECHEEAAGEDAEEAEMVSLLELTGLKHLLDSANSLDSEMDAAWYDTLSPGERQRLSWARLLYRRPKLALMDEATAAIDPELTSTLFAECEKRGINIAAVSYERKIEGWEPDMVLQLRGTDGYWTVS
uniref:Putative long-chain acyl-coa transporter n=1 Tax=Amblyomma aureolatum TaxID=187763 RepID=A0A1E1X6Q8_9ACAR